MLILKENCKCGAQFYISSSEDNFCSSRYREFLEAHKVCREMKNKQNIMFNNKSFCPIQWPVIGNMPEIINCPICGTICYR